MSNEKISNAEQKFEISPSDVESFIESLVSGTMHPMQIKSIADATVGSLAAGDLGVSAIGHALAGAKGLNDKHAIKQVDRFLSNNKIQTTQFFPRWVPYLIGSLLEINVNLDWTEFDQDDQTMIVASLQTPHGRSLPLVWKTVYKHELKNRTNEYEFEVLRILKTALPTNVHTTIVADRGFADPDLFTVLREELGFGFIIRFKANINVTDRKGITKPANDWIGIHGRMVVLREAKLTLKEYPVGTVVIVCAKGMKQMWCIAASDPKIGGRRVIRFYGKRFTIEEMFRDIKDLRFGMGMSWTSISKPHRRDKLFMIAALLIPLLTMLGQAGEDVGLDKILKPNTSAKRCYSLVRQGFMWYQKMRTMKREQYDLLITRFSELIIQDPLFGMVIEKN